MSSVHNPAIKYRPEVDGLRAVAVLPVILFHSGLHVFSGGFVGVDVFFVISGYLITSIILAEMTAGKFSIVNFYERRARRILPSLFVMMLLCVPAAWLILDPPDFKYFAKSLVAVPLFSSNMLFWMESGYFDATAELKPLLHTWTLAVEEQYYVFFPLILMLFWKLGRARIVALLAVGAVVSLVFAQIGAAAGTSASFYLLHARAWELLVGSFVAFYLSWRPRAENAHGVRDQIARLCIDGTSKFPTFLMPTIAGNLLVQEVHDPGIAQLIEVVTSNRLGVRLFSVDVKEAGVSYTDLAKNLLDHGINVLAVNRKDATMTVLSEVESTPFDQIIYSAGARLDWTTLRARAGV